MMRIDLFRHYWATMALRVDATQMVLVRNETELAQKIKDITAGELFLVAVVPSSDTTAANYDNILEKEVVIVYAVKKVSRKNMNDADMLDTMVVTQRCITNVKEMLLYDATNCEQQYHEYISRIDFNRMHTDPEYNYFECDGYSLSLTITSPGF